ncbi:L,D-transpeptidase [Microbacterium sp. AZCO]|uniref:L,D-transpeptidase n=1 Tax=Microbacterium sp. AZCO TaxID=3142976 RepID=UPI0031F3C5C4
MTDAPSSPPPRREWAGVGVALAVALAVALSIMLTMLVLPGLQSGGTAEPAASSSSSSSEAPAVPVLTAAQVAALPAVRYDAVIGGLLAFTGDVTTVIGRYELTEDAAIFGSDRRTAVARFPAKDFLDEPSTVVVVGSEGAWMLVLTPARVSLPSASAGSAPAQSAGWVAASALHRIADLNDQIVISAGGQTLTIKRAGSPDVSFDVGVGTPETPTPTGVTGYLQQRYLDASQGADVYPIQLTSLHSSAADEPYEGEDGGLIGIHYNPDNAGAVSHGCVRLPEEAIIAVNRLPLGTPVSIVE